MKKMKIRIFRYTRGVAKEGLGRFYSIDKETYFIYMWKPEFVIAITDGKNDRYLTFNLG